MGVLSNLKLKAPLPDPLPAQSAGRGNKFVSFSILACVLVFVVIPRTEHFVNWLRIQYYFVLWMIPLSVFTATGCSQNFVGRQHVSATTAPISDKLQAQLNQIQKEYNVVIMIDVHRHAMTVGTKGLISKERWKQVQDAIHKALGDDFNKYTINIMTD
jgi:hypothetical protein